MGAIEIRTVRSEDVDDWRALWQDYLAFYHSSVADDVVRLTWARLLDPAEPMSAALAWDDGRAVGLVHAIRHRSCWTAADSCYLQDLFVVAATRGQGVGRQLIEHVCREATAAGCARVYWLTHETNTEAMMLYDRVAERSGYVQYRRSLTD